MKKYLYNQSIIQNENALKFLEKKKLIGVKERKIELYNPRFQNYMTDLFVFGQQ